MAAGTPTIARKNGAPPAAIDGPHRLHPVPAAQGRLVPGIRRPGGVLRRRGGGLQVGFLRLPGAVHPPAPVNRQRGDAPRQGHRAADEIHRAPQGDALAPGCTTHQHHRTAPHRPRTRRRTLPSTSALRSASRDGLDPRPPPQIHQTAQRPYWWSIVGATSLTRPRAWICTTSRSLRHGDLDLYDTRFAPARRHPSRPGRADPVRSTFCTDERKFLPSRLRCSAQARARREPGLRRRSRRNVAQPPNVEEHGQSQYAPSSRLPTSPSYRDASRAHTTPNSRDAWQIAPTTYVPHFSFLCLVPTLASRLVCALARPPRFDLYSRADGAKRSKSAVALTRDAPPPHVPFREPRLSTAFEPQMCPPPSTKSIVRSRPDRRSAPGASLRSGARFARKAAALVGAARRFRARGLLRHDEARRRLAAHVPNRLRQAKTQAARSNRLVSRKINVPVLI